MNMSQFFHSMPNIRQCRESVNGMSADRDGMREYARILIGMSVALENGMKTTIARWESRGHAHWAELYRDDYGYGYASYHASGFLGPYAETDMQAITKFSVERIQTGYFLPDVAKTPMLRVK